jgi:nucleoside 2-deoxyribosyltransferase
MARKPRCYIASPLGFSEPGRYYYERVLLPAVKDVVEPVDPWALVTDNEILAAAQNGEERKMARTIGERNREALDSCRFLIAILDGQEVDSGTAAEVGYGAAVGLTCFGLRTDHRQSGERGATINLQVEAFIFLSGGEITSTLKDLVKQLKSAVAQERVPA